MKKVTEAEAAGTICPFTLGTLQQNCCLGKKCFAFEVVDARIEREDHSGGQNMMRETALKRKQELKREGPSGSLGVWILEERGTCTRLSGGV